MEQGKAQKRVGSVTLSRKSWFDPHRRGDIMKVQITSTRTRLGAGVASAALGLALLSSPAAAQEADASDEAEAIIVTGSRIPQANLEGASPVTSVTAADIKAQGITRVEDLLNDLPQVYGGQTSNQSNSVRRHGNGRSSRSWLKPHLGAGQWPSDDAG
jgi:outer membrane receptor protein involved in Fe transport